MSITPVSSLSPAAKTVDLAPTAAPRADASHRPALPAALADLVDRIVGSSPFPKEHRQFAGIALRDLAAELASGRPDLGKDVGPGASLSEIIKSDPVAGAAALRIFQGLVRDLKLDGAKAVAAYESLRECVPPAVVKAASPEILALMNSFSPPVHTHLSGSFARNPAGA
jgi:hypothetical protein